MVGFLVTLILALTRHLTTDADTILDIIIFGALAATFGVRGVQAVKSDSANRAVAVGAAFVGAAVWIGCTATIVAKLATG